MKSLGQYRVGLTFNPSGLGEVGTIKKMAADLIDSIDAIRPDLKFGSSAYAAEVGRLKSHAMTLVEDACRAAVAAATKPDTEE